MSFESGWIAGHPVFHNISNQDNILLILLPLFEESNRLRKPMVDAMHMLAKHDIGVALPDLPGCGDSLVESMALDLTMIRDAANAVAHEVKGGTKSLFVASLRSACLFDDIAGAQAWWRLAPENGDKLMRTLMRTADTSADDPSCRFVAGQYLNAAFVEELTAASAASVRSSRIVRLSSDRADADYKFDGSPLWRRSEPTEDIVFSQYVAEDISRWIKTCVTS